MDRLLKDIEDSYAQALFEVGDDVTIQIFDKSGNDVTPTSPDDECAAYGELDTFRWPYSNLETIPTEYEEYTWIMTNQDTLKKRDTDSFSEVISKTFFSIPFDIDLSKFPINKGDSWEPEIRVDTNSTNLNVAIELTDTKTTINKYTSDIEGGGDDQIELVAQGDTFQIFRLYLSGDETETFDSRFLDMSITAETKDGKTQTIKKKIAFTQTPAISFDTVRP